MLFLRALILSLVFFPTSGPAETSDIEIPCIQKAVTPTIPFEQLVPRCLADRLRPTSAAELIQTDLRTCHCLETENTIAPPIQILSSNPSQNVESTRQSIADGLERTFRNNLALNVLGSADDNRKSTVELLTLTGAAAANEVNTTPVKVTPAPATNLISVPGNPPTQRLSILEMSEKLSAINTIPAGERDNQCVTYLEYSAQRELPYDNSFFNFLRTASFNPSDWRIDDLRVAYDEATDEAKPAILSRMIFLSRNGQFQGLLDANPSQEFPAEVINRRQREFFNLLKTLAPATNSSCMNRENGCWEEMQRNGAYMQFKQNADAFLRTNEVTDIVSAQALDLYRKEVIRITDGAENGRGMVFTPEGYFTYLQAEDPELALGCSGASARASCYDRFSMHCTQIRLIDARIKNGLKRNGSEVVRELVTSQIVHGSLDPNQNMSFETFNDMICKHKYSNAAGEQLSFFEYRTRSCPGNGNDLPECSDRRKLLQRFSSEYQNGGEVADQNIRKGFSETLVTRKLGSVSRVEIEAANRVTETPRELRARFNGGYPAVSPQGQLVPFVPSRPGNQSGMASTSSPISASSSIPANTASSPSVSTDTPNLAANDTRSPRNNRNERVTNEPSSTSGNETYVTERSQNRTDPFASLRQQNSRTNPLPVIQPQVNRTPEVPVEAARSPASDTDRTFAPSPSSGISRALPTTEAPAPVNRGPEANSLPAASDKPLVQVAPRRRSNSFNQNALLDIYQNSDRRISPVVSTDNAPVIPIVTNDETFNRALNDPQVLATDRKIMEKVASSGESVVRLGLRAGPDGEDIVVYAVKSGDQVQFSFLPPEVSQPGRAPASLGTNEMNVRLVPEIYSSVSKNPDRLKTYDEVMKNAMELPGDIVRMNVLSPAGDSLTVYLDKRGPTPRFTLNDQAVIRAYKP